MYGPADTIQKLNDHVAVAMKPIYRYGYRSPDQEETITIFIYEEFHKLHNISQCVTLIMEASTISAKIDIITTGGQIGFSHSGFTDEMNISEQITEFILDYTKRYGLTIQEVLPVEISESGS